MSTLQIDDKTFVIGRLTARQQFHVARRLAPVIAAIVRADGVTTENVMNSLSDVAVALSDIKDADADYIMDTCMGVVKYRDSTANTDFTLLVNKNMRYDWVDLPMMLRLTSAVVKENLAGFMSAVPSGLVQQATA